MLNRLCGSVHMSGNVSCCVYNLLVSSEGLILMQVQFSVHEPCILSNSSSSASVASFSACQCQSHADVSPDKSLAAATGQPSHGCLLCCFTCYYSQADRSMESLFAELASNGVLTRLPRVELADYLGGYSYMGATLEKAGIVPEPSLAQASEAANDSETAVPPPSLCGPCT